MGGTIDILQGTLNLRVLKRMVGVMSRLMALRASD
jgi:hypothetical protein